MPEALLTTVRSAGVSGHGPPPADEAHLPDLSVRTSLHAGPHTALLRSVARLWCTGSIYSSSTLHRLWGARAHPTPCSGHINNSPHKLSHAIPELPFPLNLP